MLRCILIKVYFKEGNKTCYAVIIFTPKVSLFEIWAQEIVSDFVSLLTNYNMTLVSRLWICLLALIIYRKISFSLHSLSVYHVTMQSLDRGKHLHISTLEWNFSRDNSLELSSSKIDSKRQTTDDKKILPNNFFLIELTNPKWTSRSTTKEKGLQQQIARSFPTLINKFFLPLFFHVCLKVNYFRGGLRGKSQCLSESMQSDVHVKSL